LRPRQNFSFGSMSTPQPVINSGNCSTVRGQVQQSEGQGGATPASEPAAHRAPLHTATLPPSAGRTAEHNRILPPPAGDHQRLPQSATVRTTPCHRTRPPVTARSAGRTPEHNRIPPTPAGDHQGFPQSATVRATRQRVGGTVLLQGEPSTDLRRP
jgi:hypothetical protein